MDDKILKQIESKLDLSIDLLRDQVLTADEIVIINEADKTVKFKDFQEFIRL